MLHDLFNQEYNSVLDKLTYAEFKKALEESNCQKCALSASRTRIVVDRGNPGSMVVMVGEAPGENEDLQGRAFVGRSGRLLDSLLLDLGFDTNRDSLILNVVKCRPPENRAPKPVEVESCRPYLKRQLELIKPRVILLLGAVALRHLVREKSAFSMEKEVGSFFQYPDEPQIQCMVLYHPAYSLRNASKKPVMMEHLKRFVDYWAANIRPFAVKHTAPAHP